MLEKPAKTLLIKNLDREQSLLLAKLCDVFDVWFNTHMPYLFYYEIEVDAKLSNLQKTIFNACLAEFHKPLL